MYGLRRLCAQADLPKLALNPSVARPAAGDAASAGAYAPHALYVGCKVAAKVSQKAPKELKTTNGNVLPIMNSRNPPMIMSRPPKKKYAPLVDCYLATGNIDLGECLAYSEAAPFPPAPRHPIRSQDRGVKLRRNPRRALMRISVDCASSRFYYIHRRRVTKCLAQITFHGILGR